MLTSAWDTFGYKYELLKVHIKRAYKDGKVCRRSCQMYVRHFLHSRVSGYFIDIIEDKRTIDMFRQLHWKQ